MICLNSISAVGDPELKPSRNSCPAESLLHKFRVIMTPVWLMNLTNELEEGCCSYTRCWGHKQEVQPGATPGNNKIYWQTIAPFRVETCKIYKTASRCLFTAVWLGKPGSQLQGQEFVEVIVLQFWNVLKSSLYWWKHTRAANVKVHPCVKAEIIVFLSFVPSWTRTGSSFRWPRWSLDGKREGQRERRERAPLHRRLSWGQGVSRWPPCPPQSSHWLWKWGEGILIRHARVMLILIGGSWGELETHALPTKPGRQRVCEQRGAAQAPALSSEWGGTIIKIRSFWTSGTCRSTFHTKDEASRAQL